MRKGLGARALTAAIAGLTALALAGAAPAVAETAAVSAAGKAAATCTGTDLLAKLSPAEKAKLIGDAPYATGNFWRATKGDSTVTLVGTYHLDDPRFGPIVAGLAPILAQSKLLLVEAGPTEQAKLKQAIARDPGHMFITSGPTLPERLPEAEWQALSKAMAARGIPSIFAAKFQPWYVAMLLSVPPCAMKHLRDANAGKGGGLDARLMRQAEADGIPIRALEPWDTSLKVFDALAATDQAGMIRAALAMDDPSGDMFVTMVHAYFAGEHQLIWNFSQQQALDHAGADIKLLRRQMTMMQALLLTDRNRAWIPMIESAAKGRHIVAAFGAAHLGGSDGVLNLLQKDGWKITRLDG